MFADLLARRNRFGLLSEDIHPATGQLWGNLPQTYSMAGIVNYGPHPVAQLAGGLGARLSIELTPKVLSCSVVGTTVAARNHSKA